MTQIYVTENYDGTFNFLKVGSELMSILEKKKLIDIFIDTYELEYIEGLISFLTGIGVSEISIYKNIESIGGIPEHIKEEMLEYCLKEEKNITELYEKPETEILLN